MPEHHNRQVLTIASQFQPMWGRGLLGGGRPWAFLAKQQRTASVAAIAMQLHATISPAAQSDAFAMNNAVVMGVGKQAWSTLW
jgi:hypothetical protein